MMASPLASALAFARRDFAVFPVWWPVEQGGRLVCSCMRHMRGPEPCGSPAKHPHGHTAPNGLLSATTDSEVIKHWFSVAPSANLGVVTDKLVVIDVDPRHGGDESLAAIEREHGELPPTWRALTGGGGEHIIFSAPEGVEILSFGAESMPDPPLGRGIDVRAHGGYIVAPPSRHISGRSYAWSVDHHPADTELAPPPDWLIEKLAEPKAHINGAAFPVPSAEWESLVVGPVTEYRDMAIARLAGHLLRRWADVHVTVSLLRAWNMCHCVPPLTDGEIIKIINRIANKEADRLEREHAR